MPSTTDPDIIEPAPPGHDLHYAKPTHSQPSSTSAILSNNSQAPDQIAPHSSSSGHRIAPHNNYFRSRRVKKGDVERPWLHKNDPRAKWVTAFPIIGLILGLCITGLLIWDGVRGVAVHRYCEVLKEDFTSWNANVWTKEVEVGGYG